MREIIRWLWNKTSIAEWILKLLLPLKTQHLYQVSAYPLDHLLTSHYTSLPLEASNGNSNNLLKNSAKRRRSKAQIAEDYEREAKKRTIDQERIDEIAALKE